MRQQMQMLALICSVGTDCSCLIANSFILQNIWSEYSKTCLLSAVALLSCC